MLQNASWLVTDRLGGTSQEAFAFNNIAVHVGDDPDHVAANRAVVAAHIGAPVVYTRAGHSSAVEYVDRPVPDVLGVDALITDVPELALAAQGADCVMLAVAAGEWIAAVHCGWQGLVKGVVPATLAALRDRGADVAAGSAHIGPSICGRCYGVDESRAQKVSEAAPMAVVRHGHHVGVDVQAGVQHQLGQFGLRASADPRCTAEDPTLYSYRRDGQTGRQAVVIVRRQT